MSRPTKRTPTKRPSALAMALRLGVPTGRMANALPRQTRKIPNTGDEISEPLAEHQERDRRLNARLVALWFHHKATRNIYFALEAFNLCVEVKVNPPAWALSAMRPGVAAHLEKPTRSLDLCLGTRRRGSGTTPPIAQYKARHQMDEAMREMGTLCEVEGMKADVAARIVKKKLGIKLQADTLAKNYREKWAPLYKQLLSIEVEAKQKTAKKKKPPH